MFINSRYYFFGKNQNKLIIQEHKVLAGENKRNK